jgi:glyceraldehyde 3-phosphate dehydrogenase
MKTLTGDDQCTAPDGFGHVSTPPPCTVLSHPTTLWIWQNISMKRVAINGFGRMGRLATRVLQERSDLQVVVINEPNGALETLAVLLEFDSVQGRWAHTCTWIREAALAIAGRSVPVLREKEPARIPWRDHGVDIVLECSGKFRTRELLEPHLANGARRVVVSETLKGLSANVVMGVNEAAVDLAREPFVSAASCTTNCLAPLVRVLHDAIGVERGLVTTIHDPTNTQSVQDAPHKDARRARASMLSLIPTSTNSAHAVAEVIPELRGKLDSVAVRAPVLNASLTDFVFQARRATTIAEVNGALERASLAGPLVGILGYETRPLVSADFARDARSAIVDAALTRVTDGTLVKVMAWYDNEWGYVNRLVELTAKVATHL